MYYREKWINGWLFFKTEPKGEWQRVSLEQYRDRCLTLEHEIEILRTALANELTTKYPIN